MKLHYKNIFPILSVFTVMSACTDDTPLDYEVTKPESVAQYEYLNTYDVLKSYVDRSKHPKFKLGTGIGATDFNAKGAAYEVVTTNYDEMTAGNEMKYASVVGDDGSMNFSTVSEFVQTAKDAGITIYGHTLAWHAQQNNTYLNGLLVDVPTSDGEPGLVNKYVWQKDFEDGQPIGGWGGATFEVSSDGPDGSKCWKVTNPEPKQSWEVQAAVDMSYKAGKEYFLEFKVKGTVEGPLAAAFQNSSNYVGCGDFPKMKITTEWQTIQVSTVAAEGANRFLFSLGDYVGTFYIDDLKLYTKEVGNMRPQTPEEKADTLTWAMENWIKGMMETCGDYVTAWDAVNEALSGVDKDGDGVYDLQSVTRGTVSETDAANNFYWQDYLGDESYVRTVVRLARKYFAEYGGKPEDLKLFINDYNLESDWDDNAKMKSMLEWIKRWETDGVTKIDGIGTQMHVSYYLDEATQKGKEEHIIKMLELLASSGKLVKISELDMGIVDENGQDIKTENVTFEQECKMADFYEFIVKKYFEIIPIEQQYGITHWSPTDSPVESGWRSGLPIGLWTQGTWVRKPAYGGIADGLSEKE